MSVSIWQADDSQPRREVDFLIVGAGLVGSAAAYFAAQAGASVVVTEMRDIALGASSRNAGFMITGLDAYYHHAIATYGHGVTREIYALSERTHQHWHRFIDQSNGAVRFERIGSMLLAESAAEADDLRLAYAAMHADGIPAVFHDGDPLGRDYFAGIEQPQDGAVQPFELTHAVMAQSGAEVVANNELYAIRQLSADAVEVHTRQFVFRARHVLLCTNAYSGSIDPYLTDKVTPIRAQCLVTEPLPAPVINTCGYSDYGYMYYRMTFDGRLLIGGGRHHHKALEHDTTDDRATTPIQSTLENYLRTRFPEVQA
ncbi:MAG: FAD-binding oxidoreductase, partial [Armatimonadetes bacterium]|nr:FAD-binding oxidoreductase [Anaerolineae bacterium]